MKKLCFECLHIDVIKIFFSNGYITKQKSRERCFIMFGIDIIGIWQKKKGDDR